MLNHSTHAREDFNRLLKTPSLGSFPISKMVHRDVHDLLDSAIKFQLPHDGIVMDRYKSLETLDPSELRLPFPVVALEYCCTNNESADRRVRVNYRCERNSSSGFFC